MEPSQLKLEDYLRGVVNMGTQELVKAQVVDGANLALILELPRQLVPLRFVLHVHGNEITLQQGA